MKRQIKQPQISTKAVMSTTPNYMKATTCSARKDRGLKVSSRSPQTSDCKSSIRRKSLNSKSGNETVVRNLTKALSLEPINTSPIRSSQMIHNLKVHKATCSSIIKDHKFPGYLNLSPGETEAEGTSKMKVCKYTYCSLHGHRHDALPPLKNFMLEKKRILEAQRNTRLGCLSPCLKKPIQDNVEEAEVQQWESHEHPPSGNSSLFQEEDGEYFIEIYTKEKEDMLRSNQDIADCSVYNINDSVDVQDEFTKDKGDQQNSNPMDSFPERNHSVGVGKNVHNEQLDQGKIELDFLDFLHEMEVESAPSIQSEETDTENYNVDGNAGEYIGGSNPGGGKSIKINHMIDLEKANSPLDNALFLDGVGIVCDESFTGDIMHEAMGNETAYEARSGDDNSEFISSHQNTYDDQNHNKIGIDEVDGDLDDNVTVDSAFHEIDGHGVGTINGAQSDDTYLQKTNQESEDFHDMGSQALGKHHTASENPIEKFTNSIGIQTENDYEYHEMSWKLDEVHKKSIGTQTDFDDENKANTCFQMDQVASGNMKEEEGKHCIDGTENITLLKNSVEDVNQTVVGENDNGSFSDEDTAKESGLNKGDTESSHPGMNRTQESSGTGNRENHIEGCSPENVSKLNRIVKGNKRVIGQNDEQMEFKPRAPNFLQVEPGPDAEKVDLRRLTLDEKRTEDEWMVDYALQQALTKLAPARKRKVPLIVEAFETVTPTPNEYRARLSSSFS